MNQKHNLNRTLAGMQFVRKSERRTLLLERRLPACQDDMRLYRPTEPTSGHTSPGKRKRKRKRKQCAPLANQRATKFHTVMSTHTYISTEWPAQSSGSYIWAECEASGSQFEVIHLRPCVRAYVAASLLGRAGSARGEPRGDPP